MAPRKMPKLLQTAGQFFFFCFPFLSFSIIDALRENKKQASPHPVRGDRKNKVLTGTEPDRSKTPIIRIGKTLHTK